MYQETTGTTIESHRGKKNPLCCVQTCWICLSAYANNGTALRHSLPFKVAFSVSARKHCTPYTKLWLQNADPRILAPKLCLKVYCICIYVYIILNLRTMGFVKPSLPLYFCFAFFPFLCCAMVCWRVPQSLWTRREFKLIERNEREEEQKKALWNLTLLWTILYTCRIHT